MVSYPFADMYNIILLLYFTVNNNDNVEESPGAGSRFPNSPVRTPSKISR